eukprot:15474451-Alexandrium_andersonii.AAC.1
MSPGHWPVMERARRSGIALHPAPQQRRAVHRVPTWPASGRIDRPCSAEASARSPGHPTRAAGGRV